MTSLAQFATCVTLIADPAFASMPCNWFTLHQAGWTVERIRAQVSAGTWPGPTPLFEHAPDPNSEVWHLMEIHDRLAAEDEQAGGAYAVA